MKPECFRLASALTSAIPFKSSVPTARTVEAKCMHLPGSVFSHLYGWCLYTNLNGNMFVSPFSSIRPSALTLSLSHLWKCTYHSLLSDDLDYIIQNRMKWLRQKSSLLLLVSTCACLRPPSSKEQKRSTKMASPENQPTKCFIIRGVENTALIYHIVMGINDPITQLEALALFIFNCCSFTCHALITKMCQPSTWRSKEAPNKLLMSETAS